MLIGWYFSGFGWFCCLITAVGGCGVLYFWVCVCVLVVLLGNCFVGVLLCVLVCCIVVGLLVCGLCFSGGMVLVWFVIWVLWFGLVR